MHDEFYVIGDKYKHMNHIKEVWECVGFTDTHVVFEYMERQYLVPKVTRHKWMYKHRSIG